MIFRIFFSLLLSLISLLSFNSFAQSHATDLPDLSEINQPISTTTKLDINKREIEPSFKKQFSDGTEIVEYRGKDQQKSTSVKSSWGTHYQIIPLNQDKQHESLKHVPSMHIRY